MGNWRTVNLHGTLDPTEVGAVRAHLTDHSDYFGALSITQSLAGLGDWPAPQIDVAGNLAERNYSVRDVADALRQIVALAPSARLRVHCGDDWESLIPIATITAADGQVSIGPPAIPALTATPLTIMLDRLTKVIIPTRGGADDA